jgi:hypothetical protein
MRFRSESRLRCADASTRGKSAGAALAVVVFVVVVLAAPAARPVAGVLTEGIVVNEGRAMTLQFLPGAFWKSGVPSADWQR